MANMAVDVRLSEREIKRLSQRVATIFKKKLDTRKRKRLATLFGKQKFTSDNFLP